MRKKKINVLIILLIITITQFSSQFVKYEKIGEHNYEIGEYQYSEEEFEELFFDTSNFGTEYNISAKAFQLKTQLFRVLIQFTGRYTHYGTYGGGNYFILYLDYFMQEELLKNKLNDQIVHFENLKYIGTVEVENLNGFREDRPVFTFSENTKFTVTFKEKRDY